MYVCDPAKGISKKNNFSKIILLIFCMIFLRLSKMLFEKKFFFTYTFADQCRFLMPILYYFYPKFSNPGSGTGCWVWRPWRTPCLRRRFRHRHNSCTALPAAAVSCALVESCTGGAGICGATATVASCAGVVSCTRICGATATVVPCAGVASTAKTGANTTPAG